MNHFSGEDKYCSFPQTLRAHGIDTLERAALRELQVNMGKLCNQACEHCHVEAGPKRTEVMTWETMQKIHAWCRRAGISAVDLTGGAPELNPHFRAFVDVFVQSGTALTCRCNLTVLLEQGQEELASWYAARRVRLVCSLPCYTADNVDAQRGRGVFNKSITALQRLNALGYGSAGGPCLDLVYNPGGAFLPPDQQALEADYRERLRADFGIEFNSLMALANLPINRFAHYLMRTGQLETYQVLLVEHFNPLTVEGLMCRHLLSVDWLGRVFDCDFNQMLDLPMSGDGTRYLWELDPEAIRQLPIAVGPHCFGCTAGAGSSCGGALT